MIKYYISGPMRSKPGHNYETFIAVERALTDHLAEQMVYTDFTILNPARNFDGDTTRDTNEYMELDLRMVLDSDVLVLLPGWESSEGSPREVKLAQWTGKKFMVATQPGPGPDWEFYPTEFVERAASARESALNEATHLITGDRNSQYGPPTEDFRRTAAMATGFGFRFVPYPGAEAVPLDAHHVAIFMTLLKTSRLAWTPAKRDSWVDIAGYAGCGYECAVEEANAA